MPQFKQQEIEFLEEYLLLLQPVAAAIDILQGENNCYLGYITNISYCQK